MGKEIEVNRRVRSEAACNALFTIAAPGPRNVGDGFTAPLSRLPHQRQVPTVQEALWSMLNARVSGSARAALFAASLW